MEPEDLEMQVVERLKGLKETYIALKQELSVCKRRDVVAVELKDMLTEHTSYYSLKNALEDYIQDLYKLDKPEEESKDG